MTASSSDRPVIGAIIAGGASSRFGSPKALAMVGGVRVVDRVARALREVAGDVIAIVNDADLARAIALPYRADAIAGAGALGGVHASLLYARETGCRGALVAGCDMPFLSTALLRRLLIDADDGDAVLPESEGPRGVEPLCAYYAVACIEPIEAAVAGGDARMIGFHEHVRARRLPLDVVRTFGDPAVLFMNLNTEADRGAAERIAGAAT